MTHCTFLSHSSDRTRQINEIVIAYIKYNDKKMSHLRDSVKYSYALKNFLLKIFILIVFY